jgi:hypothetical protein
MESGMTLNYLSYGRLIACVWVWDVRGVSLLNPQDGITPHWYCIVAALQGSEMNFSTW